MNDAYEIVMYVDEAWKTALVDWLEGQAMDPGAREICRVISITEIKVPNSYITIGGYN
jgi:hypothetical protein